MKSVNKILFTIVLSLLIPLCIFAQNKSEITGRVMDQETGDPLAGANVMIENTVLGASTDRQGAFVISKVPPGTYKVRASMMGYDELTEEVGVSVDEPFTVNFGLVETAIPMRGVIITATGLKEEIRNIPATVTLVTPREVEEYHANSVDEVLRKVPGLNYQDEDGRGLKPNFGIRGLDPRRSRNGIMILVDGAPIALGHYGDLAASYYMVPVQRIERVEVVRGGASIRYGGSTVGGVINFITKSPPTKPMAEFQTSIGSDNDQTYQFMGGGSAGNLRYMFHGIRRQGDGFRDRSDYGVNNYSITLGALLDEQSDLTVGLNYHDQNEQTPGGLSEQQFLENPEQSSHPFDNFDSQRLNVDLTYKRDIDPNNVLRVFLYGSSLERNWWIARLDTAKNSGFLRAPDQIGGDIQYTLKYDLAGRKNVLTLGLAANGNRMRALSVAGTSPDAKTGATTANTVNEVVSGAFYLYDEFDATDRFKLEAGARFEQINYDRDDFVKDTHDDKSVTAFIPSIGMVYHLRDNISVFGSFLRPFKPPTLRNTLDPGLGDTELDVETSNNFEAGIKTQLFDWLSWNLSAYRMDFTDQVINSGGKLQNAGETSHQGIESELQIRFRKGLTGFFNASVLNAEFEDDIRGFKGNDLPYAPHQQLNWGLRYDHPVGLTLNIDGKFTSDQFDDAANTVEPPANGKTGLIPSYTVWNARANYKWNRYSVFLSVTNLFDEEYFNARWSFWNGIFPGPGRRFKTGFSINLGNE